MDCEVPVKPEPSHSKIALKPLGNRTLNIFSLIETI